MSGSPDTDKKPAHILWVELTTRITTQRLHFRSGGEETALESVHKLFTKTRELMVENPDAGGFLKIAGRMLNETIRPYTARWHGWVVPDPKRGKSDGKDALRFRDPQVRRLFRGELRELQPLLLGYAMAFNVLRRARSAGAHSGWVTKLTSGSDAMVSLLTGRVARLERLANLGDPITLRIQSQVPFNTQSPVKPEDIMAFEEEFLRKRRSNRSMNPGSGPLLNATGLALSGGGIKSATFCLGVVQELARRGIFRQMDYLSTVSGGGYLGTFISSYLGSLPSDNPPPTEEKRIREAFEPEDSGKESRPVRHLRNHSKYLLNGGLWGRLNIAGLLASGVVTNLLMLLPIPLFIGIFLAWIGQLGFWKGDPSWAATIFKITGGAALAFWFLMPVVQRATYHALFGDEDSKRRSTWEFITLALALVAVAAGMLYGFPALQGLYFKAGTKLREMLPKAALSTETLTAVMAAIPIVLGAVGFLLKNKRLQQIVLRLFVLSGPLFYLFLVLFITTKLGMVKEQKEWEMRPVLLVATGLAAWSVWGVNINMLAPHRYYRSRLCECYLLRKGKPEVSLWERIVGIVWRGYDPENDSKENLDLGAVRYEKLSGVGESRAAPYHLINAFVNLPASKNRNLRGRKGDFFLFSRSVCGSPSTGYVKTTDLERADPRLDLGSAMAISGAAANTNMGWRSFANFRFLMTLLNVRLGYWIPNFRKWRIDENGLKPKGGNVGLPYLLAEMGGRIQENMRFLNLSDGGHIENLGAYELLRRRCKFIVSVDGGGNRDLAGGDLQRLERYASIDFGIEMRYDITELQADEEGISRAQSILVKILYPSGLPGAPREIGWMIYLRAGITGIEPSYLLDHWRTHPLFPFESLAEQVFTEEQFEGYRCLGESAAASLFRKDLGTDSDRLQVEEWFGKLVSALLPDNDEAMRSIP